MDSYLSSLLIYLMFGMFIGFFLLLVAAVDTAMFRVLDYSGVQVLCYVGGVISIISIVLFLFCVSLMSLKDCRATLIEREPMDRRGQLHIFLAPRETEPICEITLEGEDLYRAYVYDICEDYPQVDPDMVQAMIYHESRWQPDATNYNGTCIGLMQLSTKWQTERAEQLGGTDLWDPYTNILTGVDLMAELIDRYEDPALALMMYHMRHDRARELYDQGILSGYTKSVLAMTDELKGVV